MPKTDKRARQAAGLKRFAAIAPSRAQDDSTLDALCAAGVLPPRPILDLLWRAWAFWRSGRTDFEGRPLRSLGPDPFRVLALAREHLRGRADRIDRDVALWALWTFCQVPERAAKGEPYELDLGDRIEEVTPEAVLFTFKTDLLDLPALAPMFKGRRTAQRVEVHRAIERVARLVASHFVA